MKVVGYFLSTTAMCVERLPCTTHDKADSPLESDFSPKLGIFLWHFQF